MQPQWPEIQQELKIIESEEEQTFSPAAAHERGQQNQSSSTSLLPSDTDSLACNSVLLSTPAKQEKVMKNLLPHHIPLFDGQAKGSKDPPTCGSKLLRRPDDASTLTTPENFPCRPIPFSKECLEMEDTRSDLPTQQQDWKLLSEPQELRSLSPDELSYPNIKHLEQPEWESNAWLHQIEKEDANVTQMEKEKNDKVIPDRRNLISSMNLSGVGTCLLNASSMNDPAQDSIDQQEEGRWVDHVQGLELVEPWEDHQWVTSPLHSPTFKNTQEKALQEFQPHDQRVAQGKFKKPFFSRSFSLDSKDSLKRHWASHLCFASEGEKHLHCDILSGAGEPSRAEWSESDRVEAWLNLSEEPAKPGETSRRPLSHEAGLAIIDGPSRHEGLNSATQKDSSEKELYEDKENQEILKSRSLLPQFHSGDISVSPSSSERGDSIIQLPAGRTEPPVTKEICPAQESEIGKTEDSLWKGRPRPSSLNLDSLLPATNIFTFESLSVPTPPTHSLCGQKEVKSSDSVPSLPVTCPSKNKADLWGSHFDPQDLDLDYIMMAHAATGRRNSAPVSVSAVRTSFMVKMCQARAVPVIPPKIQYTQVPQPLQTQNLNCRIQFAREDKEAEINVDQCKPMQKIQGQLSSPKSPQVDRKGKENNNAALMDSTAPRKGESSVSNHSSTQDAPVLRRKRTSEGETTGDNPQSSKMERPSGISKPSYRSRPGRPQSLILFSPPFPTMDHPSSSADSRVLLSPIKSPSRTSPVSTDLSGVTLEGVTLRNKMTIPKNGQRLETSTSCFYQPQRRSVILDGRSGRQME